jgi:hypothetical protein
MRAGGYTVAVIAEGRDAAAAAIDQPEPTAGSRVGAGGVVVERLGLQVGERVTVDGRAFRISGIAVTAPAPPYPMTGFLPDPSGNPGLIWLTRSAVQHMATPARPLSWMLNLKLADPDVAPDFADQHHTGIPLLLSWQSIQAEDAKMVGNVQQVLLAGSWLLGLLAITSVAVLIGGRMAEQTRRVGLLKAVGATPRLFAVATLTEQGSAGGPGRALAGSARPPRRRGWVVAISALFPVPRLLGLRWAARRPRRLVLTAASIAITVTAIVAVLAYPAAAAATLDRGELAVAGVYQVSLWPLREGKQQRRWRVQAAVILLDRVGTAEEVLR